MSELVLVTDDGPVRTVRMNRPDKKNALTLAMYDAMRFIKPDVATICMGMAASMGSILLTGGAAGKRYALPHTKILIHQPWVSQIGGQATDVEIAARDLIATRQTVAQIYEETTKKPLEQVLRDIDRDYYMTPSEAKDYGIIDHILEDRQGLPSQA